MNNQVIDRSGMVPAVLLPLLLLLLPASFSSTARAGGHGRHNYLLVATSSLRPKAACSGLRVIPSSNRTWLPLYHRRGPCSPFHSAKRKNSMADTLRRDQLRADDIRWKLSKNGTASGEGERRSSDVTVPTTLGTSLRSLEYVITVGLGTPAVTQTVHIDTGSDVSWVQCRPCPVPACHPQKDAFFDPGKSSTYSPFSCGSAACARLGVNYANGCSNSSLCQYIVKYGDGSNTTGTYSSDRLTLTSSDVVNNFQFGCSHVEVEQVSTDLTDGLVGLGGDTQSLVSQTGEKAFSYCLPPTPSHTGFLTLGVPRSSSSRYAVTPMYRIRNVPTFHLVLLQAITVARRRLDVPPSVFSAGSVMDSGTIITRLPPTAYRALRAAFRSEMKMYPPARPRSILDTCFNLSGFKDVTLPRVALVFDRGAAVELDRSGIMVQSCLAFTSTGDDSAPGIIGNVQQRTFEVLYDVGGGAVGFRRGAC